MELEARTDSSGNWMPPVATGIVEKIPLPDGSLSISAGWVDWANYGSDVSFVLFPDRGHPGNQAGFCAALAP